MCVGLLTEEARANDDGSHKRNVVGCVCEAGQIAFVVDCACWESVCDESLVLTIDILLEYRQRLVVIAEMALAARYVLEVLRATTEAIETPAVLVLESVSGQFGGRLVGSKHGVDIDIVLIGYVSYICLKVCRIQRGVVDGTGDTIGGDLPHVDQDAEDHGGKREELPWRHC